MTGILRLLQPDMFALSVADVNLDDLENRGIRGVLLDLDNTLVAWQRCDVPPEVRKWIKEACRRNLRLCITSNTRNPRRLARLASELGIEHVRGVAKPRRGGFQKAMAAIGTEPSNTAVIGDQIFTDVLGGNRAGLFTILVKPIHGREFIGTKFSRMAEWLFLKWLRRHCAAGTIAEWQESKRQGEA